MNTEELLYRSQVLISLSAEGNLVVSDVQAYKDNVVEEELTDYEAYKGFRLVRLIQLYYSNNKQLDINWLQAQLEIVVSIYPLIPLEACVFGIDYMRTAVDVSIPLDSRILTLSGAPVLGCELWQYELDQVHIQLLIAAATPDIDMLRTCMERIKGSKSRVQPILALLK